MELKESSPAQRSKIAVLINKLGLDIDTKEELIHTHTDGRTTSIRGLKMHEAIQVIQSLTGDQKPQNNPATKMRRKIMSMAHELGWELEGGKLDTKRLNDWCIKYGFGKKKLDDYTEYELTMLVTQFEQAYVTYLKKV